MSGSSASISAASSASPPPAPANTADSTPVSDEPPTASDASPSSSPSAATPPLPPAAPASAPTAPSSSPDESSSSASGVRGDEGGASASGPRLGETAAASSGGHDLLAAYQELAQAAGGFIHEIKNRIGAVSLNLQLLAEDLPEAATPRERRARQRIERLQEECQKLVDLAADFLRFARVRDLHLQPVALEDVITRLVDFLSPTAREKGIEIHWLLAPDLPAVLLDRDLFEQCLLNLLLNAEQAMPEGGTLTLLARREGNEVCLEVIDTGVGIPPAHLPKLFQPFFSTKPNGHGLGLAITRRIVQAHGGSIEVQSTPGHGTRFIIRLPIPEGK
ncbi:MAG: ATP-binding protein [Thermogemmata sp.]